MKHPIEAILFDLGNTLLYFDGDFPTVLKLARQAACDALIEYGIHMEREVFLDQFADMMAKNHARREDDWIEYTTTQLLQTVLAQTGVSAPPLIIQTALRAFYAVTQCSWLPEKDAFSTLNDFHQRGYSLGILSNAAEDWDVQMLVDKAGLRPFLDFVLTSAAIGVRKPSPETFRAAFSHWDFPPEQIAMVGDTLNADILGANQLGMFSVWITRRVKNLGEQNDDRLRPNAVIKNLTELRRVLDIS